MCDFSQYGGPSAEWLAVEKTLPPFTLDLNTDPLAFKNMSNANREGLSAELMIPLAPKVRMATYDIPTRDASSIQARTYRSITHAEDAVLPVFLYFHGGGFVTGTLDSENAACAALAIKIPVAVLNVNYRHSPEHTFPTPWLDSQDAFVWLHANAPRLHIDPAKVVVGGVSAGGQLSASLALEKHLGKAEVLRGLPEIAGQVLIIPALAHSDTYAFVLEKLVSPDVSSYTENEFAPLLGLSAIEFFISHLQIPKPVDPADMKLNPGNASLEQVKGLPSAVFCIAGLDPLRDEGLLYAKLLAEAGVPTDVRVMKGVPHGARRFGEALSASREWDRCLEEGVVWCLGKPEASGKFEPRIVCE
ncbi:alpha/beta hydrolase fold-3 domain-containing protein [Lentithecium fluviatile CBS 122367]|uniref:Alpha/beta hydrolase fold-3 domain-containing protein n=1 Tax=Lentithecium fluviatile CBS 122367 TaxID=1168545 RepID=A0A6G1INH3_9PLEO|nr:alpha/beta hydrolase fold-3 domain-containing protein [Lentithecium fluviatile CBS 122367]